MNRNVAMTGRKTHVDCIKAIGIVLVILGHINFANENIKPWIYSFHMPLFFFATGLVTKKCDLSFSYVLKKFRALMLPYFIWALIYAGWSMDGAVWILYGSHQSMSIANTLTSLWFLPAMFLAVLIVQLVLSFLNRPALVILASIVLFGIGVSLPKISVGYPWCIDDSLIATSIILMGYIFETVVVPKFDQEHLWCILSIGGAILTTTYHFNLDTVGSYVMLAERNIGNALLFLIPVFSGCLMVYCISKIIEKTRFCQKVLSYIGMNTLTIFVVHKVLINVFGKVFSHFPCLDIIALLVTCIGTLGGSCLISFGINRMVPNLAGRFT